jgi:phosphoribosylformylglycinamidine synthase
MRTAVYAPGQPLDAELVVVPPGLPGAPDAAALHALRAHARAGGKLLGIADGVAWLCAAELLPGAVSDGAAAAAAARTHVRVEGRATAFTWAIPAGRIVPLAPPAPGPRYVLGDGEVGALAARGRIVLSYCDVSGGVSAVAGDRAASVAGVCDESGDVLGVLAISAAPADSSLGQQLLTCLRGR